MSVIDAIKLTDALPGTSAMKTEVLCLQLVNSLVICAFTLALINDTVIPKQLEMLKRVKYEVSRTWWFPGRVKVFHADEPFPLLGPGVQKAGEGCQ